MSTSQDHATLSRRHFMAPAGGVAGVATLAAMGVPTGWAKNISTVDPQSMKSQDHTTDVLVIGGGMAGLFAAVKASDSGAKPMMVSKGRLGSSGQTPFAKGIFAYDAAKEKLSLDEFVERVSSSALGTNNAVYTRQMASTPLPVSTSSKSGTMAIPGKPRTLPHVLTVGMACLNASRRPLGLKCITI